MAKLRFGLSTWSWGYKVDGKNMGTGFFCVEDNGSTLAVKSLFDSVYLCEISDIAEFSIDKKIMKLISNKGQVFELNAKNSDLDQLKNFLAHSGVADKTIVFAKINQSSIKPASEKRKIAILAGLVITIVVISTKETTRENVANPSNQEPLHAEKVIFDKNLGTRARVPASFDQKIVQFFLVSKKNMGGQIEVYFVNPKEKDLYKLTKECVENYLGQYKSVFCYGFSSQKDFNYAEIDRKNGGMNRLCYKASYGKAISGNVVLDINDNGQMLRTDKCPSSL